MDTINKLLASGSSNLELSVDSIKEYILHVKETLARHNVSGGSSSELVRIHSDMMDSLLRELFKKNIVGPLDSGAETVALVGVGGYGRRELNPASDIDILFLQDRGAMALAENVIMKMIYPLWDAGVDLSYSVRDAEECLALISTNDAVMTSLLDARLIAGNPEIFKKFEKTTMLVYSREFDSILARILKTVAQRKMRSQKPYHFLEPRVKDSEGGLRDFHTIRWCMTLKFGTSVLSDLLNLNLLDKSSYHKLMMSVEFLWRVRNELHFYYKRKQDEMSFEDQKRISSAFGFSDTHKELGVEKFMKTFFIHSGHIHEALEEVLDKIAPGRLFKEKSILTGPIQIDPPFISDGYNITINKKSLLRSNRNILKLFLVIAKTGLPIDNIIKMHLKKMLRILNKNSIARHDNLNIFNSIFEQKYVYEAMLAMFKSGMLFKIFPEFKKVYFKVQYDIYHVYTVDIHSLLLIRELDRLKRKEYNSEFQLLNQLMEDVADMPLLYLVGLFHDIGKGYGKGHSKRGARVIERILMRAGFKEDRRKRASNLVLNHLLMSTIAQRRDLNDLKQVIDFAKIIGDRENLKIIYLLTFADLRSVGPDVWNYWKAALLQELYLKAEEVLEKGEFSSSVLEDAVMRIQEMVRAALLKKYSREECDNFIEIFPIKYFLVNSVDDIVRHFSVLKESRDETFMLQKEDFEDKKFSRIIFSAKDSPGLFSKVTGVLSSNGINILNAQINTLRNGRVLDVYHVNEITGEAVTDRSRWERTLKDFDDILNSRTDIKDLVASRIRSSILKNKIVSRLPARIIVDNGVSDLYTVIEVYSNDRPGLLYTITSTLSSLSLNICTAKISTKVDQVADVFYVSDLGGMKILGEGRLKKIKEALSVALRQGNGNE
ncbi:MAG TPA: [protein-PII] uridylyltransferase [bacterium]